MEGGRAKKRRVSKYTRGARTEEEESRGAAGEASVDQPTQREIDRRLPLGVHAQLGRTGRHDSTHRCRSK